MRKLLLLFSILQIALCSCPDGFDLVGNQCRGKYARISTHWNTMTTDAIAKCKEIQGNTIIIHNDEQQSYWLDRENPNGEWTPLGLLCDTSSSKWKWVDGSALDYKPTNYVSDLDFACVVGFSWQMRHDGWWSWDNRPDSVTADVYCTTQSSLPAVDDCLYFADDNEDGVCYQIGVAAESWQDAQLICRKLGANLASIHNMQENSFVRRLAASKGAVHGVYLGATISGKGGEFGWIDGSPWDFDYFYPGFPRAGFGECVVMDTSTSSGQWKNVDCTAQLPVACVRDKKPDVTANATCSTETWKEGSIITSPGFPFSDSMPCDYYLMVDAGKNVEVEIALLDADPCCDHLIVYDGYIGGYVLANLTGVLRNVTYTTTSSNIMLVTWEPNGGVNAMGLAMTFRGV